MKTRLLLIATTLCFFIVHSRTWSNAAPQQPPKKTHVSTQITITSAASDSITVKGPKGEQTYKIDAKTSIRVDGRPGKADDLKSGMVVELGVSSLHPDAVYSIVAKTPGK